MRKITARQQSIFDYISEYIETNAYPPTIREISDFFSISIKAVQDHLSALEKKGYIEKKPNMGRAISIVKEKLEERNSSMQTNEPKEKVSFIPIVGTVAAGQPILAEENIEGYFPLPREYVKGYKIFALRVKGKSMIEKGIMPNDYIFVKEQPNANNGDVVVALIDNEATVKTFYKRDNIIELKPENHTMQSIYVKNPKILGKVLGLNRRY